MENSFLSSQDYNSLKSKILTTNKTYFISFINPFSYFFFYKNRNLFDGFNGFFVDGGMLCKFNNFFYKKKVDRVSFDYSSIADDFFLFCELNQLRVSIIASANDELNKALNVFRTRYPDLKFGYCRNGFIIDSDINELTKLLIDSDVVIIGMGAPLQEKLAISLKGKVGAKLIITCGGFITQTSIKPDFYHPVIKKLGLRWLQRITCQPHVRKKVLQEYPKFIIKYLYISLLRKH